MSIGTGVLTLGGVTTGLAILTWVGVKWWQTSRGKWKKLIPFIASALYGMLLILSAGGILGGVAHVALWGSNIVGDSALQYGVAGHTRRVTRNYNLALTDGGHAMVIVMTAGMVALWKYAGKLPKREVGLGAVCGVSLGLAGGVAGWAAATLAPIVNQGGDWITGIM